MKAIQELLHGCFPAGHFIVSLLFLAAGFSLIFLAGSHLWQGVQLFDEVDLTGRINAVLESIAILTVAVAALELGQTILEEEVQRGAPTRVRRFLSRFMVVLVVALSIETVVLIFRVGQDSPELLAAWGVFVWLNRAAEQLEPEGMQAAKREDRKVERSLKGETDR